MLNPEPSGNTTTIADSRELDPVPERDLAAARQETAVQYACKRCQAGLTAEPEYEDTDWFLRCLGCGAKNLIALSFQIVGWRR